MSVSLLESFSRYQTVNGMGEAGGAIVTGDGATTGSNFQIVPADGPAFLPTGRARQPRPAVLSTLGQKATAGTGKVDLRFDTTAGETEIRLAWNMRLDAFDVDGGYIDMAFLFLNAWDGAEDAHIHMTWESSNLEGEDDLGYFVIKTGPDGGNLYDGRDYRSDFSLGGESPHGTVMGEWYYMELYVDIGNGDGTLIFRVNGETWFSNIGGADTHYTGSGVCGSVSFEANRGWPDFDWGDSLAYSITDVIVIKPADAVEPLDFPHPHVIDTMYATVDTAQADCTPLTGIDNYAMVNGLQQDFDSSTNDSTTVSDKDRFTSSSQMPDSGFGDVLAVKVSGHCRDTAALTTRQVRAVVKEGATEATGTTFTIPDGNYMSFHEIWELNPDTSAAWTMAEAEAAEFGYEIVT
jgi:hypothetical protein